jgi:hypothetical protein
MGLNRDIHVDLDDQGDEVMEAIRRSLNLLTAFINDKETFKRQLELAAKELVNRSLVGPREVSESFIATLYGSTIVAALLLAQYRLEIEEQGGELDELELMHVLEKSVEDLIRNRPEEET